MLRRLALPISIVINEVDDLRSETEEEFCQGILHVTKMSRRNETVSLGRMILLFLFPSQSSFFKV